MKNTYIGNIDEAAFELPGLLSRLGHVSLGDILGQDRNDMVDAIATHARNVESTLLDGMFSVAHLIMTTGCGDEEALKDHIVSLGALLKHLACETDYVRVTLGNMRNIQYDQLSIKANAKAARSRGNGGAK
jgi:hypothetical protein